MTDPFERYRPPILEEMRQTLRDDHVLHADLLRYHLGFGGEDPGSIAAGAMEHGGLCLAVTAALGADTARALPLAAALEFLHRFDLIRSDISSGRRDIAGQPALWTAWGMPLALNAADAMFSLAQICLLRLREAGLAPATVLHVGRLFDETGLQICEGEYLMADRSGPADEAEYTRVAGLRRRLLAVAPRAAALIAAAPEKVMAALDCFGDELAVAAQIRRDYLRLWSPTQPSSPAALAWSYAVVCLRSRRLLDSALEKALAAGKDARLARALEEAGGREATRAALRARADAAGEALAGLDLKDDWRRRLEKAARHVAERGVS